MLGSPHLLTALSLCRQNPIPPQPHNALDLACPGQVSVRPSVCPFVRPNLYQNMGSIAETSVQDLKSLFTKSNRVKQWRPGSSERSVGQLVVVLFLSLIGFSITNAKAGRQPRACVASDCHTLRVHPLTHNPSSLALTIYSFSQREVQNQGWADERGSCCNCCSCSQQSTEAQDGTD